MNQGIINLEEKIVESLNEKLHSYALLIEAGATTGAAIELACFMGYIDALEDGCRISEAQYNKLYELATATKNFRHMPNKDEIGRMVDSALK